jgi:hypothetical protein
VALLNPEMEKLAKMVVGDYREVDITETVGKSSISGSTVMTRLPTRKSVAYARQVSSFVSKWGFDFFFVLKLARFGQTLPFSWKYAFYYIQE